MEAVDGTRNYETSDVFATPELTCKEGPNLGNNFFNEV